MQVCLPQKLQQEIAFDDPRVLFNESRYIDDGFAKFLKEETSKLRAKFMRESNLDDGDRDRDAYAEIFDSSINLVKNTLEQVWYQKFQWNEDITEGVLLLEEKKNVLSSKMEDFKREMEELPWWHRLPHLRKKRLDRIRSLKSLIDLLETDFHQMNAIMDKEVDFFWKEGSKNLRLVDLELELLLHGNGSTSPSAQLRRLLLQRQSDALATDAEKFHVLYRAKFTSKVRPILGLMSEWMQCFREEVDRIKKTSFVAKCTWCFFCGFIVGYIVVAVILVLMFGYS